MGVALALPSFESFGPTRPVPKQRKRFACIYMPDGVPMPLAEDPAYKDWSWFPHGNGKDFSLTKCLEPLESLRKDITIISGLSHPSVRSVHGHSNADQFLTGADTGAKSEYQNSISLDQVFAAEVGDETRFDSLVMSTDGGTGTPRGTHTMSFDRHGRAIPAEHRPRRIFESLFVTQGKNDARYLARSQSALDALLDDARSLRKKLSERDRQSLDEYLDSVRETELRIEKAKRWMNLPLPSVDADHLNLDVTADDARNYLRTMLELIHLAFLTDSTRTATYQIARENGIGISDRLAQAVGYKLAHQLSHETQKPNGWKRFGTYCRFLAEEYARFAQRLKDTKEPDGEGSMLDNTLLLFGSASSAFHLSRNYPLVLSGGKNMGFEHGRYLNHAGGEMAGGSWTGGPEPWMRDIEHEDLPLSNLYLSMLHRLGVKAERFADSTGPMIGV